MNRAVHKAWSLVRNGRTSDLAVILRRRLWSVTRFYCLERDLTKPFAAPQSAVPITVRPMCPADSEILFGTFEQGLSDVEDRERRDVLNRGIGTPFVAVTPDAVPCYMQVLIPSRDYERITEFMDFPPMEPDEALLEYAYTPPAFRGKGIMAAAMARSAEQGVALGARRVITFVPPHNIASLKGCKRAGFVPASIKIDRWRFFRRTIDYQRLPPGTPYPFDADSRHG